MGAVDVASGSVNSSIMATTQAWQVLASNAQDDNEHGTLFIIVDPGY